MDWRLQDAGEGEAAEPGSDDRDGWGHVVTVPVPAEAPLMPC